MSWPLACLVLLAESWAALSIQPNRTRLVWGRGVPMIELVTDLDDLRDLYKAMVDETTYPDP